MIAHLRFSLLLLCTLWIFCGCSSYRFVATGKNINALREDSTYQQCYINDSLNLSIEVPGDFNNYKVGLNKGLKLSALYSKDKRILTKLGFKPSIIQILFSATPTLEPYYNLIAFVNKEERDFTLYDKKLEGDKILYFYKKATVKNRQIAEALIPYRNSYIGFVYYGFEQSCSFCDFDDIVERSAKSIMKAH
jgi:hypothetical protein